jgi:hypothetical protein
MMQVQIVGNTAEVKINGKGFKTDYDRLKREIAQNDLVFNWDRQLWIIHEPKKYAHVTFIKNALRSYAKQYSLF